MKVVISGELSVQGHFIGTAGYSNKKTLFTDFTDDE